MFGATQVATCGHGYPVDCMDECDDCLALESAKRSVLLAMDDLLNGLTDPDDTATRALMATASARYVSMKMHKPRDAKKVYRILAEIVQHQLPCSRDERMDSQTLLLTEVSYAAHEPEKGIGILKGSGLTLYKPNLVKWYSKRAWNTLKRYVCPSRTL